jgi:glutaredoxin 3
MGRVIVYTTDACPFCLRAKALLGKRGIEYEEINLARDPDGRAELVERTGMFTFPQILIGEQTIGGFNELLAADRAGRLTDLLAGVAPAGRG